MPIRPFCSIPTVVISFPKSHCVNSMLVCNLSVDIVALYEFLRADFVHKNFEVVDCIFNIVNICCWSSRRLQDMSWKRLQRVFSVTIFRLSRRRLANTSWNIKSCYTEDILKTSLKNVLKICLQGVLKTSWRQTKCLLGISVYNQGLLTNLNQYLASL